MAIQFAISSRQRAATGAAWPKPRFYASPPSKPEKRPFLGRFLMFFSLEKAEEDIGDLILEARAQFLRFWGSR